MTNLPGTRPLWEKYLSLWITYACRPQVGQSSSQVIHSVGNPQVELDLTLVIRGLFYLAGDLRHLVINRSAFFHQFADLFVRIHHCGVVTVAKKLPNFGQRQTGHFPTQIHRHLAS